MRVAVISDVHGNLPALEAVLADLGTADALVACGDLVGFYPDAAPVVERLRGLGVQSVRGNHELMILGRLSVPPDRAGYYATEATRRALSPDQLAWLGALPASLERSWDGLAVEVRHATPWDDVTYLYADAPEVGRVSLAEGRWLLLGHTHHPMRVRRGGGWIANPGSVGQPRDFDPRAAYAVLDTRAATWTPRRVAYDHRAYQRRLEREGWDARAIALLGRERAGATPALTRKEVDWSSRS
jgi:predicted phosphodiesterase